ncbi:MAG TPA: PH domain-containing protein [Candidatus Dormibacteraeota bacterium]|nr:PH domain-containing protein [Candidatus Dormibacteraeota bacterium]
MSDESVPVGVTWRRLHPLSPVVRFGRLVVGLLVVAVPTLEASRGGDPRSHSLTTSVIVWVSLLGVSMIAGVISWLVTRWRIGDGDLQIETGLIRRQSIRIPLARIQAVDIVAPLLGRVLGLAEVRVVSAGRGGEHGRLAYLTAAEATAARARLLALAHGLAAETPEPPAQPLAVVDNGRLVLALTLRAGIAVPLLLMVAAVVVLVIAPRAGAVVLSTCVPILFTSAVTIARTFNEEFEFAVSEAGDGMRLDRGLLQRRHETIPFGRIQALRVVQPLLWRPMGWLRLEVDVARQHGAQQSRDDPQRVARTLLPVAPQAEVLALLSRVFPEAGVDPPPGAQPPPRARLKAPLSYHFLAAWHGARYACARTGRLQAATVVVPLHKVQSVRLTSGPIQRRLRLATVRADTAGQRWRASMRCRDAREAEAWLWEISAKARLARRQTAPPRRARVAAPGVPGPVIA